MWVTVGCVVRGVVGECGMCVGVYFCLDVVSAMTCIPYSYHIYTYSYRMYTIFIPHIYTIFIPHTTPHTHKKKQVWEVATGRCMTTIPLSTTHQVHTLAWNPDPTRPLLAAASHTTLSIFHPHVGTTEGSQAASQLLQDAAVAASQLTSATTTTTTPSAAPLATWEWSAETQRLTLEHRFPVTFVCWHGRGEYFATVAPTGNTQAVLVHQLSRGATQCPFRKNKGRVSRVLFHPSKPFFFVATQNHVRVYNLAKQVGTLLLVGVGGSIPMGVRVRVRVVVCIQSGCVYTMSIRTWCGFKTHHRPYNTQGTHACTPRHTHTHTHTYTHIHTHTHIHSLSTHHDRHWPKNCKQGVVRLPAWLSILLAITCWWDVRTSVCCGLTLICQASHTRHCDIMTNLCEQWRFIANIPCLHLVLMMHR